ncbi:hypothetical protein RHMOL_Rhmol08G0301400 [Rhododendron molle]|uniref:Uncharacterized protein n=1 Tax=Rhododendron molle TaxID=49168 RepID=A0ACC0MV85_RHOML|nr:hypothetical protein RHMOL_Rhmol08G0301400 [Rhododendron molle]
MHLLFRRLVPHRKDTPRSRCLCQPGANPEKKYNFEKRWIVGKTLARFEKTSLVDVRVIAVDIARDVALMRRYATAQNKPASFLNRKMVRGEGLYCGVIVAGLDTFDSSEGAMCSLAVPVCPDLKRLMEFVKTKKEEDDSIVFK